MLGSETSYRRHHCRDAKDGLVPMVVWVSTGDVIEMGEQ